MTDPVKKITPGHIAAFLEAAERSHVCLDAILVYQGGDVVFEHFWWPHARDTLHTTHSATKSFTGAAVGLAIDEGALRLDDRVLGFFPEYGSTPASEYLELMTVSDLLTMRTGHDVSPSGSEWRLLDSSWTHEFLSTEVVRRPGDEFIYSSASSHMLSAIVQKSVGEPVSEYLRPRFFEPLGITSYRWDVDPEGISSGGNGLSLRPEDFLKWGILNLHGGRWEGRQVLPEWWVRESTRAQVSPIAAPAFDGRQYRPGNASDPTREAYGYQIWRGPGNSYFAYGLFGQLCIVVPDRDLVVAINAAAQSGFLAIVFDSLLTADPAPATTDATFDSLATRLQPASEAPTLETTPQLFQPRTYAFEANAEGLASFTVEQRSQDIVLTIEDERGRHELVSGLGQWRRGSTGLTTTQLHHSYQDRSAEVESSALWKDESTLVIECYFVETPFHDTIALSFGGDRNVVEWRHSVNVNSGPTHLPSVTAHAR